MNYLSVARDSVVDPREQALVPRKELASALELGPRTEPAEEERSS